tara:strand:- start:3760 stop:4617 length:858 start_codon:yes stop_codon:yes gene_type:complete
MERIEGSMPDAQTVSASNTSVFKLPIGLKYHELQMVLGGTGTLLADIDEIRVLANEVVIHRYSATERDVLNQFDGKAAWHLTNNPILSIPFDRYGLENSLVNELTALDTGALVEGVAPANARQVRALVIEVDINAGWPADGTIKLFASQSASEGKGAGTVLHVNKTPRTIGGAGEVEFSDLPYGDVRSQALSRVTIGMSANSLTRLKVDRDTITIFDRTDAVNRSVQVDGVRVPVSGYFMIDRTERGYSQNLINLQGVRDFRYVLTADGAATATFISEYVGSLGR